MNGILPRWADSIIIGEVKAAGRMELSRQPLNPAWGRGSDVKGEIEGSLEIGQCYQKKKWGDLAIRGKSLLEGNDMRKL